MNKPSNTIIRLVVLMTALGINFVKNSNSIIQKTNTTYKLSWLKKRKFKYIFKTEIFNWTWAVCSIIGFIHLKFINLNKEAYLFVEILENYIGLLNIRKDSIENYKCWKDTLGQQLTITENEIDTNENINDYFVERLFEIPPRLLSLKMIKYIHKDVLNDIDACNQNWKEHIFAVQLEIEDYLEGIDDVIRHYIEKADEIEVNKAYEAVCNDKTINRLINIYIPDTN